MDLLFRIADLLLTIIALAVLVRALLSWFYQVGKDPWTRFLVDITDPLLAPVRAVLSRILPIPIDFSPFVVLILIRVLQGMLQQAYYGAIR